MLRCNDPEKMHQRFSRRHWRGKKKKSGHMGGELDFVNKPSLQNSILRTFQWKKSGIQPDRSSGFFLGNGPHFVYRTYDCRLTDSSSSQYPSAKVTNKELVGPISIHALLQEQKKKKKNLTSIIKSSYSFAYSPLFPLCFLQPHHFQHPGSACFSPLRPVLLLSLHCLRFPL